MFDDIEQKNQPDQPSGLNAPEQAQAPGQKEPDDIFSEVDKVEAAQPAVPKPPIFQPKSQAIENLEAYKEKQLPGKSKGGINKTIVVAASAGILLIFSGAVIYFYSSFSGDDVPADLNGEQQTAPADQAGQTSIQEESGTEAEQPVENESEIEEPAAIGETPDQPLPVGGESPLEQPLLVEEGPGDAALDSDNDGLTDSEEAAYNTDPQQTDSDADGLFDREEVRVYQTDPLNPDTDGDGFSDGAEIKNGYNPNGPGKLFDVSE